MKRTTKTTLVVIFSIFFSINAYSQKRFPVTFRVEEQSMSLPMTILEDALFSSSYITRPVTVKFDGASIDMHFDNGATFVKKSVTKVNQDKEYEDDVLVSEKYFYTDNSNVSDTIMFVVDYTFGFVQMILPTKNSVGENIGYTSYRKFVKEEELALK